MMVITTMKRESLLDKEYSKYWEIANDSLQKLGIETNLLKKINDRDKFTKLLERAESKREVSKVTIYEEIEDIKERLNSFFFRRNNLPERIRDKQDLIALASWIKKDFGVKINTFFMHEGERWTTESPLRITYKKGDEVLESMISMLHESIHQKSPSAEQLWKSDEKSVFSLFYPNEGIRRACYRYDEGKSIYYYNEAFKSNDDALKAYAALTLLEHLARPSPDFYSKVKFHEIGPGNARYSEGFRYYSFLVKEIGKYKLDMLEEIFARNKLVPAIEKDGQFFAASPEKKMMYEIDLGKLKKGVTDIEQLKKESYVPTHLPKHLI